jgi:REP element-mobilizing transposase RayT
MILNHPGTSSLRRGRVSIRQQIYLVTTVVAERRKIFRDFWLGRAVVASLRHIEREGLARTMAFVLMPDHLHWLMQLQTASLSRAVRRFKGRSARGVNHLRRCRGRLWQPSFHDHALRKDESIIYVARYIVANPLRAGLVKSIGDYPLWDCVWLSAERGNEDWLWV